MTIPDTFLITKEIPLIFQEANTASIVFEVPETIDVTYKTLTFKVVDRGAELILEISGAQWYKQDQVISAVLNPSDTNGLSGKHRWVLQVADGNVVYDIGKGPFTVLPKTA